jgi:hypothetical protein
MFASAGRTYVVGIAMWSSCALDLPVARFSARCMPMIRSAPLMPYKLSRRSDHTMIAYGKSSPPTSRRAGPRRDREHVRGPGLVAFPSPFAPIGQAIAPQALDVVASRFRTHAPPPAVAASCARARSHPRTSGSARRARRRRCTPTGASARRARPSRALGVIDDDVLDQHVLDARLVEDTCAPSSGRCPSSRSP